MPYMIGYYNDDVYALVCNQCNDENTFKYDPNDNSYIEVYDINFNRLRIDKISHIYNGYQCNCLSYHPVPDIYDISYISKEKALELQPNINQTSNKYIKIGSAYIEEVSDGEPNYESDKLENITYKYPAKSYDLFNPIHPYPDDIDVSHGGCYITVKCTSQGISYYLVLSGD